MTTLSPAIWSAHNLCKKRIGHTPLAQDCELRHHLINPKHRNRVDGMACDPSWKAEWQEYYAYGEALACGTVRAEKKKKKRATSASSTSTAQDQGRTDHPIRPKGSSPDVMLPVDGNDEGETNKGRGKISRPKKQREDLGTAEVRQAQLLAGLTEEEKEYRFKGIGKKHWRGILGKDGKSLADMDRIAAEKGRARCTEIWLAKGTYEYFRLNDISSDDPRIAQHLANQAAAQPADFCSDGFPPAEAEAKEEVMKGAEGRAGVASGSYYYGEGKGPLPGGQESLKMYDRPGGAAAGGGGGAGSDAYAYPQYFCGEDKYKSEYNSGHSYNFYPNDGQCQNYDWRSHNDAAANLGRNEVQNLNSSSDASLVSAGEMAGARLGQGQRQGQSTTSVDHAEEQRKRQETQKRRQRLTRFASSSPSERTREDYFLARGFQLTKELIEYDPKRDVFGEAMIPGPITREEVLALFANPVNGKKYKRILQSPLPERGALAEAFVFGRGHGESVLDRYEDLVLKLYINTARKRDSE
eukprot:g6876.t1